MTKRICVILGDTSLPDPVKYNRKFNPEDFEVIERLKDALSLLEKILKTAEKRFERKE